jgi:hypothetical protein
VKHWGAIFEVMLTSSTQGVMLLHLKIHISASEQRQRLTYSTLTLVSSLSGSKCSV